MHHRIARCVLASLTVLLVVGLSPAAGGEYSWQKPPAKVLPTGDLEWAPEDFEYQAGPIVRYIDFQAGSDDNPGTRARPWKHHPWDPHAAGQADAWTAAGTTYVFKGGVIYRGSLIGEESAPPTRPTRLTCDPSWGKGRAILCGSDVVKGWTRGADHPDIPEAGKVWVADVDYLPRRLWRVDADGTVTRLKLARTPNWEISNPDDVLGEWWTWRNGDVGPNPDNPDRQALYGIDKDRISKHPDEYYEDAIVWTEYGFVMSTPIPARVEGVDAEKGILAFRGIWGGTGKRREGVSRGQRYYLEDKPHYLDQAGEFWVQKTGENSARLYLRLADGENPDALTIEAARRFSPIESTALRNVDVSNLAFRFNNRFWDITLSWFFNKEIETAGLRIQGKAQNVTVRNCAFEHCTAGVIAQAIGEGDVIEALTVRDSRFDELDNKAIIITKSSNPEGKGPFARDVNVLRNHFHHIGARTERTSNSASIHIGFPETAEIAGNILHRVYGPGIFVFGGKRSGAGGEAPLTRILIHHNEVVDSMLTANDWGGIETWQGGPCYVWNNISGNPGGYHNRAYDKWEGNRFGHAYYLDGAFKNYLFNNIAWGNNNDPESPLANTAGIQGIIGYQNTFLNNTIYRFRQGSRQQRPENGSNKHLGNIWQDISQQVFYYARPRGKQAAQPNEMDVPKGDGKYNYPTMAWANNVFYDISGSLGAFEENGRWFTDVEAFNKALKQRGTLSPDAGVMADASPLRDPDGKDFRLVQGSPAVDYGCKTFIPWGLYATVGEWHFTVNRDDPGQVLDEHWFMTKAFRDRKGYMNQAMYPLTGTNIADGDYVDGPLENWTRGALKLDGQNQYLTLDHAKTVEPASYSTQVRVPGGWAVVTHPDKALPGKSFPVKVSLPNDIDLGRKLIVQLGYVVSRAWGGIMDVSEPQTITGEGPYEFTLDAEDPEDLKAYVLIVSVSPTGKADNTTRNATIRMDVAEAGQQAATKTATLDRYGKRIELTGQDVRSPQIYQSNFLIETYIKVQPGASGVIVQKWDDGGYMLKVAKDGRLMFRAGRGEELTHNSPILTSKAKIADGRWHHVIAEADRSSRRSRFYIDGKPGASGMGVVRPIRTDNEGDLYVGGTPDGECLAATIEFLRISQGTLADARTTIDELYTWQFDGPQFRDFTSAKPAGKRRDAGAIELRD